MSDLIRQLQGRFDAAIVQPDDNEIERADKTLLGAARLFYAAVVERRSLQPASPDYFSSSEPGALKHAQLNRYETMARVVLAELGAVTSDSLPDDDEPATGPAWGGDAPPPGALVVDTRLRVSWRVIRSRAELSGRADASAPAHKWKCLCERLTGEAAGEQEWIPASELEPHRG